MPSLALYAGRRRVHLRKRRSCPAAAARFRVFCRLAAWLARRLQRTALRAGREWPLSLVTLRLSRMLAAAGAAGAVASAALLLATGSPLAVAASAIPLLLVAAAEALSLASSASERAKLAEADLPFLSLWAWLFERSGAGGLRAALEEARSSGLLPGAAYDAGQSLAKLADYHPSSNARRFYRYYLAIVLSGGDAAAYLRDTIKLYVEEMRARTMNYSETALAVGSAALGIIGLGYIASTMGWFIGGPDFTLPSTIIGGVLGYTLLHSIQPRLREKPPRRWEMAAAAASAAALPLLGLSPLYAALAALAPWTLMYIAWRRRVNAEERELPATLRLIIEKLRSSEKPVARLLLEAAREVEEPLATRLREAATLGTISSPSWIVRYALYTLRHVIPRAGAADVLALEQLYDLTAAYVTAHRAASARLRSLAGLALIAPGVGYAAAKVLERFTAAMQLSPFITASSGNPLALVDAAAAAISMGLVAAKASSYTVRNTGYALAALAVLAALRLLLGG